MVEDQGMKLLSNCAVLFSLSVILIFISYIVIITYYFFVSIIILFFGILFPFLFCLYLSHLLKTTPLSSSSRVKITYNHSQVLLVRFNYLCDLTGYIIIVMVNINGNSQFDLTSYECSVYILVQLIQIHTQKF